MEINLTQGDSSSLWLENADSYTRASYGQYMLGTADSPTLVEVQKSFQAQRVSKFTLLELEKPDAFSEEKSVDLAIVKGARFAVESLAGMLDRVRQAIRPGGYLLLMGDKRVETRRSSDASEGSSKSDNSNLEQSSTIEVLTRYGLTGAKPISGQGATNAYLAKVEDDIAEKGSIEIVRFREPTKNTTFVESSLQSLGWDLNVRSGTLEGLSSSNIAVVLDEIDAPLLSTMTADQWSRLKELTSTGCKLLWLTTGSQMDITNPEAAMIHGLFRTVRAEDISLSLATLD